MSIEQMRAAIREVYPGQRWKLRVNNMKADQVYAIYNHFLNSGKFDEVKKIKEQKQEEPKQMTLADYYIGGGAYGLS